jgi:hypothetical protein
VGFFSRKATSALPPGTIDELAGYGSTILASRSGQVDTTYGWEYVGPVVAALRGPNQDAVIQELYEAPGDGSEHGSELKVIGAYSLLCEWDPTSRDGRYMSLLDRFLIYVHGQRYSSGHLTRYEADRWIELHGDLRSSFDGIVEVAVPGPNDAPPVAELDLGTQKLLALTAPLPEGNAFYAERGVGGKYVIFSERRRSSDDPTRRRYDETNLGSFSSLADLLRAIGQMFGSRPYWADPAVDPYFPSRRT